MNLSIISTEQIVPPARYSAGAPYRQVNSTFAEERKKHDQQVQQHQSCMWSAGNVAAICRNRNRATVFLIVGTVLFMVGLAYYAKAKGRNAASCLMCFLSIIGLIVVGCLKDLEKETTQ